MQKKKKLCLHLCEDLKQPKLIDSDRNQINSYLEEEKWGY